MPSDNTPELEALAQLTLEGNEKLSEIDKNTESALPVLDEMRSNTEANVVATNKLQDPLERIAKNTERPAEATFNIGTRVDGDDVEFNENLAGKALWAMLRGPKGAKGDRGEQGIQGEKGEKGEKGERGLTGPAGPQGKPGKDGKDGRDGVDGADGKDGKDGKDGRDGRDGKDASPAPVEQYRQEFTQQLSKEIERVYQKVGSKTYAMSDLSDTQSAQTGQIMVKQADGSWAPGSAESGGGHTIEDESTPLPQRDTLNFVGAGVTVTDVGGKTTVSIPGVAPGAVNVEVLSGVNGTQTVFSVSAAPLWVVADGVTYFAGAGYSYSALTVTFDSAPQQFARAII